MRFEKMKRKINLGEEVVKVEKKEINKVSFFVGNNNKKYLKKMLNIQCLSDENMTINTSLIVCIEDLNMITYEFNEKAIRYYKNIFVKGFIKILVGNNEIEIPYNDYEELKHDYDAISYEISKEKTIKDNMKKSIINIEKIDNNIENSYEKFKKIWEDNSWNEKPYVLKSNKKYEVKYDKVTINTDQDMWSNFYKNK